MQEPEFENEAQFTSWLERQMYPRHFDYAYSLLSLAEDAMERKVEAPSSSAYARAIVLILGKAYKSYLSAVRLGSAGLTEDMGVIIRSLLNLYIIARWISKSHREDRARRYLAWFWIEMYRLLELVPTPADSRQEIEREYRRYKGLFEYRHRRGNLRMTVHWHRSNIKRMATETGLLQHYNVVYKPLSATEHSSALSYFGMLSESDKNNHTLIRLRDHEFVPFYLGYGYQYLAGVLFLWSHQFRVIEPNVFDTRVKGALDFFAQKQPEQDPSVTA